MGQTRIDAVDHARAIVDGCLAREFFRRRRMAEPADFATTLHDFQRYRSAFGPDFHPAGPRPAAVRTNEAGGVDPREILWVVAFALVAAVAFACFVVVQFQR